jgi:hypothetical protein
MNAAMKNRHIEIVKGWAYISAFLVAVDAEPQRSAKNIPAKTVFMPELNFCK